MTDIVEGYQPGLLGWTVAEHGTYYSTAMGFGAFFEAKVATEMADFVNRSDAPGNHIWSAHDTQGFLATITLDGERPEHGLSRIRWYYSTDRARGLGLGRRLLNAAVTQAHKDDARGIYLTTLAGLDAARRLYERFGFVLVHEQRDRTWGKEISEQRFELVF